MQISSFLDSTRAIPSLFVGTRLVEAPTPTKLPSFDKRPRTTP